MRHASKLFLAHLTVLLIVSQVATALAAANGWVAVASLPTTLGNSGASAGPCTGNMSARCVYSIGALNEGTNAMATVNMYNPATNAWSSVGALNTARTAFGTTLGPCVGTLKQNCIYAIGGADTGAVYLATVEMYNPKTNKWSLEPKVPTLGAPATFPGRAQLAATRGPCFNQLSQTCIYAIGGYNPALYQLSSVEMFNPATTTWTAATGLVTSRSRVSAASGPCHGAPTATCLYAIGGTGNSGFLSSVEMYDPAPTRGPRSPPSIRRPLRPRA